MPAVPELLDTATWKDLAPGKRAAYDDDRIAHHSRLLVVQTPAVRDVITTGPRLAHMNRSAHYGRSAHGDEFCCRGLPGLRVVHGAHGPADSRDRLLSLAAGRLAAAEFLPSVTGRHPVNRCTPKSVHGQFSLEVPPFR